MALGLGPKTAAQTRDCNDPSWLQKQVSKAHDFLNGLRPARPLQALQEGHLDLNQAMGNEAFAQKMSKALIEWSQGIAKNDPRAVFDIELLEIMPQINREYERMQSHLKSLKEVLKKVRSKAHKEKIRQVLEVYQKLLSTVMKKQAITYDQYIQLMHYHQAVQSYQINKEANILLFIQSDIDFVRQAQREMAHYGILVAPTFEKFSLEKFNQLLAKDHTILGMSYVAENFDAQKGIVPLLYMSHDSNHILKNLKPFFKAFEKLGVDRKSFFKTLLAKMDEISDSETRRDLHLLLLTLSHEQGNESVIDITQFSSSFKNERLKHTLMATYKNHQAIYEEEVVNKRMQLMDKLWSESLEEAKKL